MPRSHSARSVGTLLWLYEAEAIRQRVRQVSVFDCVRFAQKANSNTHIPRLLRSTGVAVDAVSRGEIEPALRPGYVPGLSPATLPDSLWFRHSALANTGPICARIPDDR